MAVLAAGVGDARAGELGDRIAETLCYPPSATRLALSDDDGASYRQSDRLSGDYRDIQGADARAWFEKSPGGAVCRTPADSGLTLFFCAAVSHAGGVLTKDRARLCP
ncbi:MAG: hypothetical protein RLO51_15540 [Thalassobaculum sp.]|uniref:hypothetical protein n=1 Tax=Thalassobaculum sp. TaxID=2022740 RepID=UPI0032EDF391